MTDWDEKGLLGRGKLAGRGKIRNIEGVPVFIPIFNFGRSGEKVGEKWKYGLCPQFSGKIAKNEK
jgi:hypothetical protein